MSFWWLYIYRIFCKRGGGGEMLGIPGKLLDEEGSWLIIVQDTNHCLSVINQPDSMFNIVFYHINIMMMNVYIRIFLRRGVKCLGENYTATSLKKYIGFNISEITYHRWNRQRVMIPVSRSCKSSVHLLNEINDGPPRESITANQFSVTEDI